ncbi:MAG TPA: Fe-S cluster assembly protein SufD [Candidatus Kryptonia bacterium]
MPDTSSIKNWYLTLFKDFENQLNGEKSGAFHRFRKEAIDRFAHLDFPDTHQEDWRFTDIGPILEHSFAFAPGTNPSAPDKNVLERNRLSSGHTLVFVNGFINENASDISSLPDGVTAGSLARLLKSGDSSAVENVRRYAPAVEDAFTALNSAFAVDGAYIAVPDNTTVEDPINVIFISQPTDKIIIQPRNLVIAGRNSRVKVIEQYVGANDGVYFTNAVTAIHGSEGSTIDSTIVQSESRNSYHVATTAASLESGAGYTSHAISLGAKIYRHNLNVALTGEGSSTNLEGLYLLSGDQLSDTHSFIDHIAPHCTSGEHYKGILDGRSRGVFNGKIMVRKGAQQTNSYQENRNIILSNDAKVDTKPQLEIFADDVKCSHGATVGQLSKESMFYLRSRGISEEEARLILIYAFASDVLKDMTTDELKTRLENLLSQRFLGTEK